MSDQERQSVIPTISKQQEGPVVTFASLLSSILVRLWSMGVNEYEMAMSSAESRAITDWPSSRMPPMLIVRSMNRPLLFCNTQRHVSQQRSFYF